MDQTHIKSGGSKLVTHLKSVALKQTDLLNVRWRKQPPGSSAVCKHGGVGDKNFEGLEKERRRICVSKSLVFVKSTFKQTRRKARDKLRNQKCVQKVRIECNLP